MTVRISVQINPHDGAGSASVSPSEIELQPGGSGTVDASATANPGWVFVSWSSGSDLVRFKSENSSSTTATVGPAGDGDVTYVTVYANFGPQGGGDDPVTPGQGSVVLNVRSSDTNKGTVTPASSVRKYGESPPQYFSQTINATAKYGYEFDHWEINGRLATTSRSYTVTSAFPSGGETVLNAVAYFRPVPVTVTFYTLPDPANRGSTTPTAAEPLVVNSHYGATVSLPASAKANRGFRFDRWTRDGRVLSRSSSYSYSYKVTGTSDVVIVLTGHFEVIPPSIPPQPPDWPPDLPPYPPEIPPDVPEGSPYVEVITDVSPRKAVELGATAYPSYQVKCCDPGGWFSFGVWATPYEVFDEDTGIPYYFSHWEDGDGNRVSSDRGYSFSEQCPFEGSKTIILTAVYSAGTPEKFEKLLKVTVGCECESASQAPDGGEVNLGYGSVIVEGGEPLLQTSAYNTEDSTRDPRYYTPGHLYCESYCIGYDSEQNPIVQPVPFYSLSAVDPEDGHCYFVRWEIRLVYDESGGAGPWQFLSSNSTISDSDVGGESYPWEIQSPLDPLSTAPYKEVRAIFAIKRRFAFYGNAGCDRVLYEGSDTTILLDSVKYHDNPEFADDLWLKPGETKVIPFIHSPSFTKDPPDGLVHKEYWINAVTYPTHYLPEDYHWETTLPYYGFTVNCPEDTSDFRVINPPGFQGVDFYNGWTFQGVRILYRRETGLPIHDSAGRIQYSRDNSEIICDKGPCPNPPSGGG